MSVIAVPRRGRKANRYWLLANLPAYVLVAFVVLIPFLYEVYISFFAWELIRPPMRFIGLRGYRELLLDPFFQQAFVHTVVFTFLASIIALVLGLGFALAVNRGFKGQGLFRGVLFIPWAITPIVVGLLWSWIYHAEFGVLNYILLKLGLTRNYISILSSESYALPAVIATFIWQHVPFATLIQLAGLQAIDKEYYEAAMVDGAGVLSRFWYITLPLLRNTILLAIIFLTMWAFRTFDLIYAMTYGGPGNSTTVLGWYTYRVSFAHYNFGRGAASGIVMALFTAIVAVLYVRLLYKRIVY